MLFEYFILLRKYLRIHPEKVKKMNYYFIFFKFAIKYYNLLNLNKTSKKALTCIRPIIRCFFIKKLI